MLSSRSDAAEVSSAIHGMTDSNNKSNRSNKTTTNTPTTTTTTNKPHIPSLSIMETSRAKSDMIEYMINKRVKNLDYLKRVHEGHVFWLNVVKINSSDIERYYHPQTLQKRVQQWFYLGVSIAPLLQLENGWSFVRACAQLMEEYEYHFANVAVQGMV